MNQPQAQEVAQQTTAEARNCLKEGVDKIEHCLAQLTDEQVWRRPRPEMNCIANLMLHLSGNVRQWIISGIGGAKDVRNRPGEFADQSRRPKHELLATLKSTVDEADGVPSRSASPSLDDPSGLVEGRYVEATVTAAVNPAAREAVGSELDLDLVETRANHEVHLAVEVYEDRDIGTGQLGVDRRKNSLRVSRNS